MRLELLILTGPDAGRRLELGPAAVVLGRSDKVTLAFPQDTFLSSAHVQLFALADGSGVQVTDLQSTNGTFLNGQRISGETALPGDVLKIGSLALRIVPALTPSLDGEPVLSDTAHLSASRVAETKGLTERLFSCGAPLFGVVDAAADPVILELLQHEAGHTMQSLYEGHGAQDLAPWAPYLVAFPPRSTLLQKLLCEGWGKGWASYCCTHVSFPELRRHLRHFLMVQLEEGAQVYFRFYDPRVLREFLPTATFGELLHFFGPVQEWLIEGAYPESLLRNRCTSEGLTTEALPVHPPTGYTTSQPVPGPHARQIS